jgi:thiol-disulfide isomerase/thioredoxin
MSSDKKHPAEPKGYSTPSFSADLFATLAGLALVYGMITLVGNGQQVEQTGREHITGQFVRENPAALSPKTIKIYRISQVIKKNGPFVQTANQTGDKGSLKGYARGKLAAFLIYKQPKPLPEFSYVDEQGGEHSLKELRGKVVLLNLWATWCGPCRHEMPWLDTLKNKFKDRPFEMLTISTDRGGLKKPRRFFNKINIRYLTLYGDKTGRLASKLRAFGMPTTLLIGPQGRELGRIAGPAEWASKDAFAFIEAAIALTGAQKK